jgi:hypothetical protein
VGRIRRNRVIAQLSCAALLSAVTAPLGARAEQAGEPSRASSILLLPTTLPVVPTAFHEVRKLGERGVAHVTKKDKTNYALRLVGSNANREANREALKAGEAEHKYVGVEMIADMGALLKTELQTRYIQAQNNTARAALDLQSTGQGSDERRALQELSLASNFLANRVKVSSYRRESSISTIDSAGSGTIGRIEQHHVTAALWQSRQADFSVDAAVSKASPNFRDFGDSPEADLHANNRRISQYRSKFRFDRFGVSVVRRETAAVAPVGADGVRPSQTEGEAKLSLSTADLRNDLGILGDYRSLLPLPDSVWLGESNGWMKSADTPAAASQTINKTSMGAIRAFGYGAVNVSYWQSVTRVSDPVATGYGRGNAHGLDLGSNLHFGPWGLSGNLSLLAKQDSMVGPDNEQNTRLRSIFATWRVPFGADLKAGLTTNSMQSEIFGYSGSNESNSFRYQLALDLSRLASTFLHQGNVQMKVFASFRGNQSRTQTDLVSNSDDTFAGLQLALPINTS